MTRPPRAVATGRPRWGYPAATWALLFASLHLFWALGGSWLLASSAGITLARTRPTWFVLAGLWGVALLLVTGAALGLGLAQPRRPGRAGRPAAALAFFVGVCLLLRGIAVQIVLLTDAGGVSTSVGQEQTQMSLILWNPWFVVGGALFVAAGTQSWREQRAHGGQDRDSGATRRLR